MQHSVNTSEHTTMQQSVNISATYSKRVAYIHTMQIDVNNLLTYLLHILNIHTMQTDVNNLLNYLLINVSKPSLPFYY